MRIEDAIKQPRFEDEYHKLAVNLVYTQHHFAALLDQVLSQHDISPEQFNVLRIVKGKHPQPMALKDIHERMLNKMSNTSRLVEKLRRKGLVRRAPCAHDRRAVDITLSDEGLAQLATLNRVMARVRQHYRTLSEDEARQLNLLLDRLRG